MELYWTFVHKHKWKPGVQTWLAELIPEVDVGPADWFLSVSWCGGEDGRSRDDAADVDAFGELQGDEVLASASDGGVSRRIRRWERRLGVTQGITSWSGRELAELIPEVDVGPADWFLSVSWRGGEDGRSRDDAADVDAFGELQGDEVLASASDGGVSRRIRRCKSRLGVTQGITSWSGRELAVGDSMFVDSELPASIGWSSVCWSSACGFVCL